MKLHNKTILVTGGAGFIGSEVTRQLCDQGARVLVVDNLANGRAENLEGLPISRCRLEVADIRDEAHMFRLLHGVDIVFHLACLGVRHSIHSPQENHEVNAGATLILLKAARQRKVPRFVYLSSSEVYGTALWTPMTEEHPTFPMTVYGASKLAGEAYARAFFRTYGYPVVVVRPFNTYGPRAHHEGDSGEVIPKFMLRCLTGRPMIIFGDGRQTREYTHVTDTARGIIMTGLSAKTVGQTINVGSGQEISIRALAEKVARAAGCRAPQIVREPDRPGDVRRLCADSSKARKLCGFKASISLDAGLAGLRDWYLKSGKVPEDLLEEEIVRNWEDQRLVSGRTIGLAGSTKKTPKSDRPVLSEQPRLNLKERLLKPASLLRREESVASPRTRARVNA